MPTYKKVSDKTNKITWYCSVYYTDHAGERKRHKKEGFPTQREAKDYERKFLEHIAQTPDISFSMMIDKYLQDKKANVRPTTYENTKLIIKHIEPFFKDKQTNKITPADVRQWQNSIKEKDLSPTTQRLIHTILSSIFNYAIKFHGLTKNPCRVAGTLGTLKASRMTFITPEQFNTLIMQDIPYQYKVFFSILFYSGLRSGEALALTLSSIDLDTNVIHVTQTTTRTEKSRIIYGPPKTKASIRDVPIPPALTSMIADYIGRIGPLKPYNLLFENLPHTNNIIRNLHIYTDKAGLPRIRLHDFRHSHASLLINMDIPPIAIRDRLGHESIETTLNIYAHLYPTKQQEIIDKLNDIMTQFS